MRTSFLAFTVVALVASTMTAASAFNYAQSGTRAISFAIVDDDSAYLAIAEHDWGCYTNIDGTSGKISVVFDVGTACGAGGGTGINAASTYYFLDALKVTNKGTVTLTNLWFNVTGSTLSINTNAAEDTMLTSGTFNTAQTATTLAVGSSIWIGFKVDASSSDKSNTPLTGTISVEARSTN